jgi:hypothetical protein
VADELDDIREELALAREEIAGLRVKATTTLSGTDGTSREFGCGNGGGGGGGGSNTGTGGASGAGADGAARIFSW